MWDDGESQDLRLVCACRCDGFHRPGVDLFDGLRKELGQIRDVVDGQSQHAGKRAHAHPGGADHHQDHRLHRAPQVKNSARGEIGCLADGAVAHDVARCQKAQWDGKEGAQRRGYERHEQRHQREIHDLLECLAELRPANVFFPGDYHPTRLGTAFVRIDLHQGVNRGFPGQAAGIVGGTAIFVDAQIGAIGQGPTHRNSFVWRQFVSADDKRISYVAARQGEVHARAAHLGCSPLSRVTGYRQRCADLQLLGGPAEHFRHQEGLNHSQAFRGALDKVDKADS